MKKVDGEHHESIGRPRSAPAARLRHAVALPAPAQPNHYIARSDLDRISECSAAELIQNAQLCIANISEMRKKMVMLPQISSQPRKKRFPAAASSHSGKVISIVSSPSIEQGDPASAAAKLPVDALDSDPKFSPSSQKLRPVSAVLASRSAPSDFVWLQSVASSCASSIIRFFTSHNHHDDPNGTKTSPTIVKACDAGASPNHTKIASRWKRACSLISNGRDRVTVVAQLMPILHEAMRNLEGVHAPEIVLASAIVVHCTELCARIQNIQDWHHDAMTKLRQISLQVGQCDGYSSATRASLFKTQALYDSFSRAQLQCLSQQQLIDELHAAHSAVMMMEVQDSTASFEASAVSSMSIRGAEELMGTLSLLQQDANTMFSHVSSSFVSSFLQTCAFMESTSQSSAKSMKTKRMVPLPLLPAEDEVLISVGAFLECCSSLQDDFSRFLFIDHSERLSIQSVFSKAEAACIECSQMYKQYAAILENHRKVTGFRLSFEKLLHNHNFSEAGSLLREIERLGCLISEKSSSDVVSQCQNMFSLAESNFEKCISEVRHHIQSAQQCFDLDRDNLKVVYEHIEAAQTALLNIRCVVPESLTLDALVAKVKSSESRRFWQAKSSVQLGLSSVNESLTKLSEEAGKRGGGHVLENLNKLVLTIGSLRAIIDKFCITDDAIINQVHSLQIRIDDHSVLASGARLEPLELTYSNCARDFQTLVFESDELHQLEHGTSTLVQIQYRLKRFQNRSVDRATKQNAIEMCERCSQEIVRIEHLRSACLEQSKIDFAELKESLSRASAHDESDCIPNLHSRILNLRQVANAIDDQETLSKIVDLCREMNLVVEHRDNWLCQKVLVSLSEAESVFRNHRSHVADLVEAIDKLKRNDTIVAKIMNSALQMAVTSKIEKAATELKRSLVLIQDDQRDKKAMLDEIISKLQVATASFMNGFADEASFAIMLKLQSSGLYLRSKIHIEAEDLFGKFDGLSLFVSEINEHRERVSSMIIEANSLCKIIELWLFNHSVVLLQDSDVTYRDLQPLLEPLRAGSRMIFSLRMHHKQDTCLADRLQASICDVLVIAIYKMKEFLSNSRQDVAAVEKLLAENNFAPAVPIVDLLKESIGCHQVLLLHLKYCSKTILKFNKTKVSHYLTEMRLLEFDLLKLVQHFDQSAHELPLLRAGVLAQGEALLHDAHVACVARNAGLSREKLRLAILLLQKVCEPGRWKLVSEELNLLDRRCFAEAAASLSLCKLSQAQSKLHNYNAALTILISACKVVEHWNLNKAAVTATFEYIVSSALELLSEVCSASNQIWERFESMISQNFSSCQGQNLILAVLDIVQHRNLMKDVVHKRMLGEETTVWDDLLRDGRPVRTNCWNSSFLKLSPLLIDMSKELNAIIEKLEVRNDYIGRCSDQVLAALSQSMKASLVESGLLSTARCRISDDVRERRLVAAVSEAQKTIIAIVNAGISPDYILSIFAECVSLRDCMTQLGSSELSFSIPYHGMSLPHVSWLPPKNVKLDVETTSTLAADVSVDLHACLELCCCALAEKEMEDLELKILFPENKSNIGFLYSAAALAPGAFFDVLLSRHSCQLDSFQTLDGLTLLHLACCYCNHLSLKVILENQKSPDLLFATDCFGRNVLHFLFGANRDSVGLVESAMFTIFDSTYAHWVSLQECISKFSPNPECVSSLGGFHEFSRHSSRHTHNHRDLDIVLQILQRDMYQHLDKFTATDHALNNFMHRLACRRIKGHRASQPNQKDTKIRRSGLFGNLHSNHSVLPDKASEEVVDREKEQRDLCTLHKIFQIFQKPSFLTLLNDENIDGMTPLLLACFHGNSTVVALFILQLGADAACCDLLQRTPLHFAADCNDRMSFQLLLKCPGIDASAVDYRKQTALFRVASMGFDSLFAEFSAHLSASSFVPVSTKTEARSRRKASSAAHQEKTPSQLEKDSHGQEKSRFYFAKDRSNNSLLHAAAFSGSDMICRQLLTAGLLQNEMNDLALTPLHIATIQGHSKCLNILATSLRDSTKSSHPELAASLMQSLLLTHEATTSLDTLKALILGISELSSGGSLDEQHNGSSLAHTAVVANRCDVIQALVELKAKSCVPASGFTSIVHACAFFNRPSILSILSSKGVDCSSVDAYGRTPFHISILQGSKEAAVALVQMRQYPLRSKDDFGLTAFNYLSVELLKTANVERTGLQLYLSKHKARIDTVLSVVKSCPEVLLDALPCGISIFHLLATDASLEVVEIFKQISAAVGEVVHAMPFNPFDARVIPVTAASAFRGNHIGAASKTCARMDNTVWMQPYLRPGDTPVMVAVRCCNSAALSIIIQYSSYPNRRCSCKSPLAQALQPRLQQQRVFCSDLAQILLVHSSGGFSGIHDAKTVAQVVARYAGSFESLLLKPSLLLEKLKAYKAFTAAPCLQFKRNALCELFLRQPLERIQQVISVMHSNAFAQVCPVQICDLNGNSVLHHIFMRNRSESHILGLWALCMSIIESNTIETLPMIRNNRGKSLLHKVCRFCSVRTLQVVLRALTTESVINYAVLFDVPKFSNCSPFSRALKYGNVVLVRYLLSLDISISALQNSSDAVLSQTLEALRGPKSSLKKIQTLSSRSLCLDSLRQILPSSSQIKYFSLEEKQVFEVSLKCGMLKSSQFKCTGYDETELQAVDAQLTSIDLSEISNMFAAFPFKESGFPPHVQLPQVTTECSERQLKISRTWDKLYDFLVSMNDSASNFDAAALSFNSQKCIMQLMQLPHPSNTFCLSIVWFSMSNVISTTLCHHEEKLESEMSTFNFTSEFLQRLRFLIEIGQDVPCFCRPPAEIIHRTLGMQLEEVDAFVASQVSINQTAARVCANSASALETLTVYIKSLQHAQEFFSNLSHFALERLSVVMNQENPTSESLLHACSKIPPLLYSHVRSCYLMSIVSFSLESIGLSDEWCSELLLESQNMQNLFKSVIPSDFKSYSTWKYAIPETMAQSSSNFVHVDFKSCLDCTSGSDFLKHLTCRSMALNARDMQNITWDVHSFLETKSAHVDVIEECFSLLKIGETISLFKLDDSQRISYLCGVAKQFESMKLIIDKTFSSLSTCEHMIQSDLFFSASDMLSSISKSLEQFDVFERAISSKISDLVSVCATGMCAKEDTCNQMLRDAAKVLAEAAGLKNIFIHDVELQHASSIKVRVQDVLLQCNEITYLIQKDACIPHRKQPWSKVPTVLERLNSSLTDASHIIDDAQRIACSHDFLRICRIFEGKSVNLLPSAIISSALNPLNLGPLLQAHAQTEVESFLKRDAEFNQSISSHIQILENWMSVSNNFATSVNVTSDDLISFSFEFSSIKHAALEQLTLVIDVELFNRASAIEIRPDCVEILKTYFGDRDSCDAIINYVTKESSDLHQVLSCIIDAHAHSDNLLHHCQYVKALESAKCANGIKNRINALNHIVERLYEREREEAAIKIQRIARGVLVRRLDHIDTASSTTGSTQEFKWERQMTVRNAFITKIVDEIVKNMHKLVGLHTLKYRYEPSVWHAHHSRRCLDALKLEKKSFDSFFALCKRLDRDALSYEQLDETALSNAARHITEVRKSHSEEDWTVARNEFCIDINSIESKLRLATEHRAYQDRVSSCLLQLRTAHSSVQEALDSGNHLLALHVASSNWNIDSTLSSSEIVIHEVERLRSAVADSISKISADCDHARTLAGAYSKSLSDITFQMEQAKYEEAHRHVELAHAKLREFKDLVARCSGITVRYEDVPQVDSSAVSQLQSALLVIVDRDKAIERLEASDYCIGGLFQESYALINQVNSSLLKLDAKAHAALCGPVLQIRERVNDAVKLIFRELRRVSTAIRKERVDHMSASLVLMIKSHQRLLTITTVAAQYSTKVSCIRTADFSSDILFPNAEELDETWWKKVQNQLVIEERFLSALLSLECQSLKEAPAFLTQHKGKHISKKDFCCSSASFIQNHLAPILRASCGEFPLPSLVSHLNLEDIVTELRDFVRNYITEFDNTCSSFLSNISQMSQLYSKSRQQIDSLPAEAADGNFALCNVDALSQIADDFDKCELLATRSLSLLDDFSSAELPVNSDHLRWFKLNAVSGSKAAQQCRCFIEKVTVGEFGNAAIDRVTPPPTLPLPLPSPSPLPF